MQSVRALLLLPQTQQRASRQSTRAALRQRRADARQKRLLQLHASVKHRHGQRRVRQRWPRQLKSVRRVVPLRWRPRLRVMLRALLRMSSLLVLVLPLLTRMLPALLAR